MPDERLRVALFSTNFTRFASLLHSPDELLSFSLEYRPPENKLVDAEKTPSQCPKELEEATKISRRYFRCAGKVRVSSLKTLLRHKLGLSSSGTAMVEICHSNDTLDGQLTMMDVAYIYTWRKTDPMRLFFQVSLCGKPEPDDVMPELTKEIDYHGQWEIMGGERQPSVPPVLEPESDDMDIPEDSPMDESQTPPKLDAQVDLSALPVLSLSPAPVRAESPTLVDPVASHTPGPSSIFPKHITGSMVSTATVPGLRVPPKQEITFIPPPSLADAKIERIHQLPGTSAHSAPGSKKPMVEVRPEIRKKVATVRPKEPPVGSAGYDYGGPSTRPKVHTTAAANNDIWRFCVPPSGHFLRPVYHTACSPFTFAVGGQSGPAMFPQGPLNSGVYVAVFNPTAYPYRPGISLPTTSTNHSAVAAAASAPVSSPDAQSTSSTVALNATTPSRAIKRSPSVPDAQSKVDSSQNVDEAKPWQAKDHVPRVSKEGDYVPNKEGATGSKRRKLLSPVKRSPESGASSGQTIKLERPLVIDEESSNSKSDDVEDVELCKKPATSASEK